MERNLWVISWGDVLGNPWQASVFIVAVMAELTGQLIHRVCWKSFMRLDLHGDRPPADHDSMEVQLRFWHEVQEVGYYVCACSAVACLVTSISLCALAPQPRATGVCRSFLLAVLWSHLLWPLLSSLVQTCILSMARTGSKSDGLLTLFPGIMEFLHVGVHSDASFLTWRVQVIHSEENLLRKVHSIPKALDPFMGLGPPKEVLL